LTLSFSWADGFTGLTGVFKVGTQSDFTLVQSASLTIDPGDATLMNGDLSLVGVAKGCYVTQLHLTDGGGDVTIVEGPTLIVKPQIDG